MIRQTFSIRVSHDRAVDVLFLGAVGGAAICAGVAGGIDAAGAVALLAARLRRRGAPDRYDELRFDVEDTWAVAGDGCGVVGIDAPVVHLSHRAVVLLEVSVYGESDFLVFAAPTTAPDDLRRLRAILRSRRLAP